jgi:glycosyltransferase involved in cell wall biosynthesis
MVTPSVPHPFGDAAAKWFYVLIRDLLRRGCRVVCLTASQDPPARVQEAEQFLRRGNADGELTFRWHQLKSSCGVVRRKARNLLRPYSEMLYTEALMIDLKREIAGGYDVFHLDELWSGWLGIDRPRSLLNIYFLASIDWELKKLESFKEWKEWVQIERATRKILANTKNIRLLSSCLLEKAKSISPGANYWIVPIALDISLYPVQPVSDEPVVGLIGSMHWVPSRSAGERLLTRIWPIVKKGCPGAKLYIAGWNAKKYLGGYLPLPDVAIEENLSHPEIFFSRVAVMTYTPERGSGMKVKVMESMAYGVPVVTTLDGVEGIECNNGHHCWVAETDEAIAEKIIALLGDVEARKRMSRAARGLLEEKYSPLPVVDQMMDVYEEVVRRG